MVKAILLTDRDVNPNYAPVFSLLGFMLFIETVDINKLLSECCLKCLFLANSISIYSFHFYTDCKKCHLIFFWLIYCNFKKKFNYSCGGMHAGLMPF